MKSGRHHGPAATNETIAKLPEGKKVQRGQGRAKRCCKPPACGPSPRMHWMVLLWGGPPVSCPHLHALHHTPLPCTVLHGTQPDHRQGGAEDGQRIRQVPLPHHRAGGGGAGAAVRRHCEENAGGLCTWSALLCNRVSFASGAKG